MSRNGTPELPSQVDIRREAVLQRNTEGASTRQIAEDLGISHMTVSRDLHAAHSETDLHLADPCEPVRLTSDATIGLDGKTYRKPAAAAPRRRPLADGWRDATLDLKSQVSRDIQVSRNGTPELPSQVDIRREAVLQRNTEGASTRQIAEDLGISHMTVSRDLHAAHSETDLHLADPCEPVRLTSDATIGLDGKTYRKPAAAAPRRRPLADGWRDATLDLSKLIERIERLTTDDRFPSNKDEIARYANDLIRARDALAGVIEQFN